MLNLWRLALRSLWREWRAGEWVMVALAILISVTALTSLHFYTDRIGRAIQQQSTALLGGDLVVSSPTPLPASLHELANTLDLQHADVWVYPSMVSANQQLQLASISAVSSHYPLTGNDTGRPEAHTVWIEGRLLSLLGLRLRDQLNIGSAAFTVSKILSADSEALNTGWLIAPRVIMQLEDVPATKTVLPGSRVDYRLLLSGNQSAIKQYREKITPTLLPGQQLIDIHNQRFPLRDTLQQMENFLNLLLLACLIMSGIAIAMSTQQYLQRHYTHVALWRCLGLERSSIVKIFILHFLIIALLCGMTGSVLGYALQFALEKLLQAQLPLLLPPANFYPLLTGMVISTLLLFGFAYPVIHELPNTPPLLLWRNVTPTYRSRDSIYPFLCLAGMLGFILIFIGLSTVMLFYAAAMLLSVALVYLFSFVLLKLLRLLAHRCDGALRHGLHQLIRHPNLVSTQLTGFTLILASFFIVIFVRDHLLSHWQTTLSPNTPNYFVTNIAPEDVSAIQSFMARHQVRIDKIDPIVRGRITALNGKPILSAVPPAALNNNALHRELNLSWMNTFPADNQVVRGRAWTASDTGKAYVSVEKNLSDELGLKLGDEIQFRVGDQFISATIHSVRTLNWSSFHPNFYMIFPPGVLNDFPSTYITSFHLQPEQSMLLNSLASEFPNLTIIDIAAILTQVQQIVEKATFAIQYIFIFMLLLAIVMLVISLQATRHERKTTYRLMHILGASKSYLRKLIAVESITLIIIILLGAGAIAWSVAWQLNRLLTGL